MNMNRSHFSRGFFIFKKNKTKPSMAEGRERIHQEENENEKGTMNFIWRIVGTQILFTRAFWFSVMGSWPPISSLKAQ
jgi:hypothetical protein